MRWREYPKYKPSGVEWLGAVPEHWGVRKLKHISSIQFSNVDKHTVEGERPVRLCNYVDVYYNDFINADLNFMEATAPPTQIAKFALRRGDVIITKDSEAWDDIAVPAYVSSDMHEVLCGYHLAKIRPDPKWADGKYLFRAFCSRGINDQFRVAATGITRYGLGKYWLDNGLFLVPPVEEQLAIATFLDRETGRIDTLMEKKQRQIELLQEKRTALINHAVTKGLDGLIAIPPSQAKPSWQEVRIGRVIKLQRGFDITGAGETDGHVPVISSGGLSGHTDNAMVKGPGVIVGRKGTLGTVNYVEEDYWPHDTTLWVKEFRGNFPRYVYYFLIHMKLEKLDVGAANPTLNRNHVHPIKVRWPDKETQETCANFLDRETSKINALIAKVQESIDRLKEYRTALISAAVTGQIDIRKAAP